MPEMPKTTKKAKKAEKQPDPRDKTSLVCYYIYSKPIHSKDR
jgi:hypothetical protein